jgi:hypothetical protein
MCSLVIAQWLHIVWTPCVAHCLNMMVNNVCQITLGSWNTLTLQIFSQVYKKEVKSLCYMQVLWGFGNDENGKDFINIHVQWYSYTWKKLHTTLKDMNCSNEWIEVVRILNFHNQLLHLGPGLRHEVYEIMHETFHRRWVAYTIHSR